MRDFLLVGFIVGSLMYWGKAVLVRLILGKRFHRWITSTAMGLGFMDLLFTLLGAEMLQLVHAEGVLALIILVTFGSWTTFNILTILGKRKAVEVWNGLF